MAMKPKDGRRDASNVAERDALARQVTQAVKSMMVSHNGGPPLDDSELKKKIDHILSEASERRIAGAGDNLKTDPVSEPATMSVEEFAAEVPMGRKLVPTRRSFAARSRIFGLASASGCCVRPRGGCCAARRCIQSRTTDQA